MYASNIEYCFICVFCTFSYIIDFYIIAKHDPYDEPIITELLSLSWVAV